VRLTQLMLFTLLALLLSTGQAFAFTDNDPLVLCADTGGSWNDCGSGCGPATCDNPNPDADGACPSVCTQLCECPAEAPLWAEGSGCISDKECGGGDNTEPAPPGMGLCEQTGGEWDWCGSGCGPYTCDNLPPSASDEPQPTACPSVCVELCACPAEAPLWDATLGCIAESACGGGSGAPPSPNELCSADGGSWNECGSGCGPLTCESDFSAGVDCDLTVCVEMCDCPEDEPFWDDVMGCHDGEMCDESGSPQEVLCAQTGGSWKECGSGCGPYTCDFLPSEPGEESEDCPAVCVELCGCPAEAPLWNDVLGCIAQSTCETLGDDVDQDGYPSSEECDDNDAGVYPGATEVCNGKDDNCDGDIDEGCDVQTPELLCEETGGQMGAIDDCAPFSCDKLPGEAHACTSEAKYGCQCPDSAPLWSDTLGCYPISECEGDPEPNTEAIALCGDTDGEWDTCGSGCGPYSCDYLPPEPSDALIGEDCPAMCVQLCACPAERPLWDEIQGCIAESACPSGSVDSNEGGADPDTELPESESGDEGGCQSGSNGNTLVWIALFGLIFALRRRLTLSV